MRLAALRIGCAVPAVLTVTVCMHLLPGSLTSRPFDTLSSLSKRPLLRLPQLFRGCNPRLFPHWALSATSPLVSCGFFVIKAGYAAQLANRSICTRNAFKGPEHPEHSPPPHRLLLRKAVRRRESRPVFNVVLPTSGPCGRPRCCANVEFSLDHLT